MLTDHQRETLVEEVSRLASESTSAEGLGAAVMPSLQRLVDASSSVFYRVNERGHVVPLAGTLVEPGYRYSRDYYTIDPLQAAMRDENPWVFKTSRSPAAWRNYIDGPVYGDLCRHYDIHTFLHVRLVDAEHGECGMYGIMLAHGEHQPDFTSQEELLLIKLLPELEASIRRNESLSELHGPGPLEAALEVSRHPTVVMDARGGLLWCSKRAANVLGQDAKGKPHVPEPLYDAALMLGATIAGDGSAAATHTSVRLQESVVVDLRLARTGSGAPVVVAELDVSGSKNAAGELAGRFGLTPTQAAVLGSLAQGLSDRGIAQRHRISMATVRTHVGQILARLGVRSRVQAALMATGARPAVDDEDDSNS
jgi:DNA-binding CsgD family transcriptional regulator